MEKNDIAHCSNCNTPITSADINCPGCRLPRNKMILSKQQPDSKQSQFMIPKRPRQKPISMEKDPSVSEKEFIIEEQSPETNKIALWFQNTLSNMKAILIEQLSPSRLELPPVTRARKEQLDQMDTLEMERLATEAPTKPQTVVQSPVQQHKKTVQTLSVFLIACLIVLVVLIIVLVKYIFGQ